MEISNLIIPTGVARPGMTVARVFQECVGADVPGIPFQDADGRITGKASLRHVLKVNCIPDFMVRHSHLLGNELGYLHIQEAHAKDVLTLPIDSFILQEMAVASSSTPVAKALAIMEDLDTTYLFIIDDGVYRGIISVMGIGRALLNLV
jgi:CBS domain-containing protein